MAEKSPETFVIDCPECRAKVAALEGGRVQKTYWHEEAGEPFGELVRVGTCPKCSTILVGSSHQTEFAGYEGNDRDEWKDAVRVFPMPARVFSSRNIPKMVIDSLDEADRALQAGANMAGCVMLGRALEALCRDMISRHDQRPETEAGASAPTMPTKKIMLGEGIKRLRDLKVIDDRLFDWSQQLQAFRNLAAHPEDAIISREDADDLQVFANAIVEYVYELSERYADFKARAARPKKRGIALFE